MHRILKAFSLISLFNLCGSAIEAQVHEAWVQRHYFTPPPYYFDWGAARMKLDGFGNVYVAGTAQGTNLNLDVVLLKYDAAGNLLWRVFYNSPTNADDFAADLAVDNLGNAYITGTEGRYSGNVRVQTVKYDSQGHQLWAVSHEDRTGASTPPKVRIDAEGSAYVTLGSGYGFIVVKYDASGNQSWERAIEPENVFRAPTDLAVDNSGSVYVTGDNFVTAKLDTNGNLLWQVQYAGAFTYYGLSVALALDSTGSLYVIGASGGENGFPDFATIKYDSNGNQLWVARYDGPTSGYDEPQVLRAEFLS